MTTQWYDEDGPSMVTGPRQFQREFVSAECSGNDHRGCSHLSGVGGGFTSFLPGAAIQALLCHCACHAGCGLSSDQQHTVNEWFDLCSCPGAELARQRAGRPPDVAELMRKGRDNSILRREAIAEARAASAGKSRGEAREILTAALNARGLPTPQEPVMELELDGMMTRGIIGRARLAARGIKMLTGLGNTSIKDLHSDLQPAGSDQTDPILVAADRSGPAVEVNIDPEARHLLDSADGVGSLAGPEESVILVGLRGVGPPVLRGLVAIYVGDHRVGVLSADDSTAYHTALEASMRSNKPLVAEAVRRRGADDSWRLHLYPPTA